MKLQDTITIHCGGPGSGRHKEQLEEGKGKDYRTRPLSNFKDEYKQFLKTFPHNKDVVKKAIVLTVNKVKSFNSDLKNQIVIHAIPIGGSRKVGSLDDNFENKSHAQRVADVLSKIKGFDNAQVYKTYGRYGVAWGNKDKVALVGQKFKDNDHKWLGTNFGFQKSEVEDHLKYIKSISGAIGDDAIKILHKKVGKSKGLDSIEKQIRDEATRAAKKSFGGSLDRVAQIHIDRYVKKRMGYMKKAFKKLDNPKTDTSKQRGDRIGVNETKTARSFGLTKGLERLSRTKKKDIYKQWVTNGDGCVTCTENEATGPIPIGDAYPSGDYSTGAHLGCDCDQEFTDDDGNEVDVDYDEGDDE